MITSQFNSKATNFEFLLMKSVSFPSHQQLKSATAAFEDVFSYHGYPKIIISYNASFFKFVISLRCTTYE